MCGMLLCKVKTLHNTYNCLYSESEVEEEPAKGPAAEVDERQQLMAEVDERKRKILREVEVSTLT